MDTTESARVLSWKIDLRAEGIAANSGPAVIHFQEREPCPWLPQVESRLGPGVTRGLAEKRVDFYLAALSYSQSLWMEGKPAQAILQLNKAWMANLDGAEDILTVHPPPYRALRWIIERAKGGEAGFMGNPVRHFQHLASRMSGPRAEARVWRAWACFHLASFILDAPHYPRDGVQIAREGLWIPGRDHVLHRLRKCGWIHETSHLVSSFKLVNVDGESR
jgi:hypothetical protein